MILVTGGTGLLGAHLLFELTKTDFDIRALKRKGSDIQRVKKIFGYYSDDAEGRFNKIQWVEGDLLDKMSIYEAMENVQYVYHTGAEVSLNKGNKKRLIEINYTGTLNIVNACLEYGVKKLCHVSSITTLYEKKDEKMCDEEFKFPSLNRRYAYKYSKTKAEIEVWRGIAEGLNAVIVNLSVIIGPGFWDRSIGDFFVRINKIFPFYAPGVTGFVDVRDAVKSMLLLMDSDISGERFILNSENLHFKEILTLIAYSLNKKISRIKVTHAIAFLWYIISPFLSKKQKFSRELTGAMFSDYKYSNEKIRKISGHNFRPVKESIEFISGIFKEEITGKQ